MGTDIDPLDAVLWLATAGTLLFGIPFCADLVVVAWKSWCDAQRKSPGPKAPR